MTAPEAPPKPLTVAQQITTAGEWILRQYLEEIHTFAATLAIDFRRRFAPKSTTCRQRIFLVSCDPSEYAYLEFCWILDKDTQEETWELKPEIAHYMPDDSGQTRRSSEEIDNALRAQQAIDRVYTLRFPYAVGDRIRGKKLRAHDITLLEALRQDFLINVNFIRHEVHIRTINILPYDLRHGNKYHGYPGLDRRKRP